MRLLLDTHAFLWSASDPSQFCKRTRATIEDSANEVFVSAAVGWEIAIKHALGKLEIPSPPLLYVPARLKALGFKPLAIALEHALAVCGLPDHHNDPFDRIMVAQAQAEGLTLVTNDHDMMKYPVKTLAAV